MRLDRKISVIIPVKNRKQFLSPTLNSIINQSLSPYEIIVVDDHSQENFDDIKSQYKDKVLFVENKGIGGPAARNYGFKISTGQYIQFFDSDDLITMNKFEVQAEILSQGNAMVYGPFVSVNITDKDINQRDAVLSYLPLSKKLKLYQYILRGWCILTQACLFNREIFKESGLWNESLRSYQDFEFLNRIGKVVPYPAHENKSCVFYRQHLNQITETALRRTEGALDHLKSLSEIKHQIIEKNSELSYYDKLNFNRLVKKNRRYIQDNGIETKSDLLFPVSGTIVHEFYNKIIAKIEYLKNGVNWRNMHGANSSPQQFNLYKSLINLDK